MTHYKSTEPERLLSRLGVLVMSVVLAGALTAASTPARAIEWGINGPPAKKMDVEPIFKMMKARGLTQYRVGVNLTKDTEGVEAPMLKHMVELAKTYGITLRPLFGFGFRWGDRTDAGNYPAGDRDALYQQGFNRTYAFVDQFKNDIDEWELENEINLAAHDPEGKRMFGRGGTAAEYEMPIMEDWAAVLKGASDAIDKINKENGLHLRRTMNTTSTMFGFLDFMAEKGVGYDVISYHYYEVEGQNPHRNWNGRNPPFDLFKKLASYHKPIVFNEVNCGEIYNPNYGNKAGDPLTERCLHTLNTILTVLRDQKDANIKSVSIYNLMDEPAKKPPENRFGLMYDLNTPKVPFYLLTRFAGGHLSDAEAAELSKRGL
ncbi:glycosyl hydrolase 53 family protein [Streptomyces sp. AcH 505]|uniref:glycosyl hydrolase 53 family protein n=1 Tax=Streptomyces sp. AcH 505 TaxID=352211 RepID=UPI0005A9AE37